MRNSNCSILRCPAPGGSASQLRNSEAVCSRGESFFVSLRADCLLCIRCRNMVFPTLSHGGDTSTSYLLANQSGTRFCCYDWLNCSSAIAVCKSYRRSASRSSSRRRSELCTPAAGLCRLLARTRTLHLLRQLPALEPNQTRLCAPLLRRRAKMRESSAQSENVFSARQWRGDE